MANHSTTTGECAQDDALATLTRTALHVLAGFWPQPIQWIGVLLGAVSSLLAFALGIGPAVEVAFALLAHSPLSSDTPRQGPAPYPEIA